MAITATPKIRLRAARLPGGLHYSWVIVAVLGLVQVIGTSVTMSAGVMVVPLNDADGAFGWSIGLISVAIMLFFLVGGLFAPVSGWMGDRYGARRVMVAGSLLYGVGMVLLGIVAEFWQFLVVYGFIMSLAQSITMVPLMAAVSGWFRRRLGLGVGLLWASGGVGAAVLAPLLGFLIEEVGWRGAFWTLGIAGGGIMLAMTLLFRNRPADLGLRPYGTRPDDPPEVSISDAIARVRFKVFQTHMRRTKAYWNLPLVHAMGCMGHGIILIFAIPIAIDEGVGLVAAAVILSLISVFSIITRFFVPILAERFGGKAAMVAPLIIQGLTVLVLFGAHDLWTFYLFAVLFGVGFGGEMSAYLVVNRQYFGMGPLATYYGVEMMGALFGHALAVGLGGLIIYATGSFDAVLILSMAASLTGVLVIWNLESSSRVLIPDWEDSLPPEARSASLGLQSEAD